MVFAGQTSSISSLYSGSGSSGDGSVGSGASSTGGWCNPKPQIGPQPPEEDYEDFDDLTQVEQLLLKILIKNTKLY